MKRLKKLSKRTHGILFLGLFLSAVWSYVIWDREQRLWFEELEQEAFENALILNGKLAVMEQGVNGLAALYNSSSLVGRQEFGVYVSHLLQRHKFIRAFEWAPRIFHSERDEFEKKIKDEGFSGFHIHESMGVDVRQVAGKRGEYYPVQFAEPLEGNQGALGLNLAADSEFLQTMNEARDSGKISAIARGSSGPGLKSGVDLVILAPFYADREIPNELGERRKRVRGFVLGIYWMNDMIDQMVKPYLADGMNLVISEGEDVKSAARLFGTPMESPSLEITHLINVANRRWFLTWEAGENFSGGPEIITVFWGGTGILGVSFFLAIIIEIITTRTRLVEKQVQVRTEELTKANRELVVLNDLKNKFLGMASHDLRNPLASIRGYSKFLLDKGTKLKEGTRHDFLDIIHTISKNMVELLGNLLDISMIESGQLNLQFQTASLNKVVGEKVRVYQFLAENKSILIHCQLEDIPAFLFDANRMSQVVDNLLSNAIKYSPPGKAVYVSLEKNGSKAKFSVRDEGPGISQEERGKLFKHFQKLSAKPTGGEASSGLGLAIARRIVEEHGGNIDVTSQPSNGATFCCEIPMKTQ